jgi:hypothetical protein
MTDIVEQLRNPVMLPDCDHDGCDHCMRAAATEIEQIRAANIGLATESHNLQQEVERLRLELAQAKLAEDAAANLEAEILRLRADLREEVEITSLTAKLAQNLLAERDAARAEVERLRAALRPFANIRPSTLYPGDGSEKETYVVILDAKSVKSDFTGSDLARARAALAPGDSHADVFADMNLDTPQIPSTRAK